MTFENIFWSAQRAIFEGRYSDAEEECHQLLTQHAKSSKPSNMSVVTWLHGLAQALEGQGKWTEARATRRRAVGILRSFMSTS